jgi:hypothetical protein
LASPGQEDDVVRNNNSDEVAAEAARLNDEATDQAHNGPAARPTDRRLPDVDEDERVRIHDEDESISSRSSSKGGSNGALIGLGLTLATAGAAAFFFAKAKAADDGPDGPLLSDAPDHVLRGKALKRARNQEDGRSLIGRTVTIGKPAQELYSFWRKFERFPEFMDNVREIKRIDETRSEWLIEAPAGVMQREPNVQARRDLRRFKQLMETGEVPVNASPSGRRSESPTEARI